MSSERNTLLDRIHQLEQASSPLEPGETGRRQLRGAAVDSSERFLRTIEDLKAYEDVEGQGIGLLDTPITEEGIPLEAALEILEREVVRPGAQPASAGHLAYIPGGGIYHAALADFLAAVHNKFPAIFFTGPGPVRMENLMLRWVADLVGYPAEAGGNLTSGGSLATLIAVATARDAHGLKAADYSSAVVYLTSQAHHCLEKALHITGLGEAQVRTIPIDEHFRMRPEALKQTIAADRRQGLKPWLIAAAAGTTDTGAVDPLEEIAEIAERERCWFHVDAAYGGFFLLTGHGRSRLRGIERSDSTILDPHKSLFLPWGSGIVLVRDAQRLAATHSYSGDYMYMQDAQGDSGEVSPAEVSPADVSPEMSKPFRALRMWLPLVLLGTRPFQAALDEKLLLARYFHEEIQALGFEAGPSPDLSVVTFRWAPPGLSLEETNQLNHELVERIRQDGRIFLSSTLIDGRFTLRLVALSFRTHRKTIDLALQILREQTAALGA